MKHLKHLLAALVFVSLIIFTNCGGGGGGGNKKDSLAEQAENLVGDWVLQDNGALLDGTAQDGWDGFSLEYTGDKDGGDFSTSGSNSDTVWPSNGTWEFVGDNPSKILRSDDVEVTINSIPPDNSALVLQFTISSSEGSRTSGIDGRWTFRFDAQ